MTRASDAARNTGNGSAGSRNTPGTDPANQDPAADGRKQDRGRGAGQSGGPGPWPISSTPVGGSSAGSSGKSGSTSGAGPAGRGGNGGSNSGNQGAGNPGSSGQGSGGQGAGGQGAKAPGTQGVGKPGSPNQGSPNQGSGRQGSGNTGSAGSGSSGGAAGGSGPGPGGASPNKPTSGNPGSGSPGSGSPGSGKSSSGSPGSGNPGTGSPGAGAPGHGPVPGGSRPPGAGALPSGPPRSRPPLPGPPPGMRLPGPPMGTPRFAPQPPPRRRLTGGQRSQLVFLTVALLVVGAVLGYAASLLVPTQYAARTTIQYNIAGENTGDFLKTDRNLTTQTVLLTSRNVLGPVADANGIAVDSLTRQVSASILNASDIIQLQVRNSSPDTAVTLANAIAKQYITVANSSGPQGYLQSQLDSVKKQQVSPGTVAETTALATRAATLQAQLDQMNLTQNQSSVLVPAYALTDPVSPNKSLAAITGGICGLIIALMTVVTLSRRWTRN
jgi:capsular polysaccharide biosynthesis protein